MKEVCPAVCSDAHIRDWSPSTRFVQYRL